MSLSCQQTFAWCIWILCEEGRKKKSLNTSNIKCLGGRRGSGDQLCSRMLTRIGILTGLRGVCFEKQRWGTSGKSQPVMNLPLRQWQKFICDKKILPAAAEGLLLQSSRELQFFHCQPSFLGGACLFAGLLICQKLKDLTA